MTKSPLEIVQKLHGGKDKLVDKLMGVIEPHGDDDKDSLRERLRSASNKKLLRLLQVSESIQKRYGGTEKLTSAVATALGRAKDADYMKRLGRWTPARLLDMAESLAKKAGSAAPAAAAAATATKAKAVKAARGAAAKATKATAAKPAKAKAEKPAKK